MRVNDSSDKCFTCQLDELRDAGVQLTDQERNRWAMWGCTCDPERAAEAMAYFERVTQ